MRKIVGVLAIAAACGVPAQPGSTGGGSGAGGGAPYTGPKTYSCNDTCTCPGVSPTSCGGDMWCAADVNAANQKEKTAHPGGSCVRTQHCTLVDDSPCTP